MLIEARADLPGDNDPALLQGPLSVRVDIYISGEIPGGPGLLTLPSDGRRRAYVQIRAHLAETSPEGFGRWCHARRSVKDGQGRPWIVTASGLRAEPGADSAAAVRELSSIGGAEDMASGLAVSLGVLCVLGARGPMSLDSDNPATSPPMLTVGGVQAPPDLGRAVVGHPLRRDTLPASEVVTPLALPGLGDPLPDPDAEDPVDRAERLAREDAELAALMAADAAGQDIGAAAERYPDAFDTSGSDPRREGMTDADLDSDLTEPE